MVNSGSSKVVRVGMKVKKKAFYSETARIESDKELHGLLVKMMKE